MKQYVVIASEMKRYDHNTIEKYRIPSLLLMERAALVTVEELQHMRGKQPCKVLVMAGCGNNGGDGLAIGRLLMLQGYDVTCILLGNEDRCTEETARQICILREYGVRIFSTIQDDEYDIVIDAIYGIGLSREVEGISLEAVKWMNNSGAYVCSVDIPSGVRADTGEMMGCAVQADLTVTYGFRKLGHLLYPGAGCVGKLVCRRMGIDERSFLGAEPYWYTYTVPDAGLLPARRPDGNKGTFGKVLVIAGSREIAGAALLAAKSTLRIGAGMMKVVTAAQNKDALLQYVPEAMVLAYSDELQYENGDFPAGETEFTERLKESEKWADCILIGPGIGTGRRACGLLRFAIEESRLPLIIDADGLNIMAQDVSLQESVVKCGEQGRCVILTPHMGEFARLYGCTILEAKEHMTEYALRLCEKMRCILVCKDARTVVVGHGSEHGYINITGNSGMATAGSGDVLAGMIAGLVAQRMSGTDAAVTGVYLHGTAGDLAAEHESEISMTAADIIDRIGDAILLQQGDHRQREAEINI